MTRQELDVLCAQATEQSFYQTLDALEKTAGLPRYLKGIFSKPGAPHRYLKSPPGTFSRADDLKAGITDRIRAARMGAGAGRQVAQGVPAGPFGPLRAQRIKTDIEGGRAFRDAAREALGG